MVKIDAAERKARTAFVDQSDDELAEEVRELEERARVFRLEHVNSSRAAAHRKLDELLDRKRAAWAASVRGVRFAVTRSGDGLSGFSPDFDALAWTRPEVGKAMHAAIDAKHVDGDVVVEFTDLSEGEYRRQLAEMRSAVADREDELEIREANREAARVLGRAEQARERRAADRAVAA
ncbi:MAG: hypothetical protein ACEQSX_04280 [Baekduiaceae bacterium]